VTGEGALTGGVIAAGDGRRLRAEGWTVPKPMVPVAGVPLLEVVVGNLLGAGIAPVTVIVNEREGECVDWARRRFPGVDLRFIVKTTASSLESFARVTAAGPAGPMLVSTVDAWCRPADFARFVAAARRRSPEAMVLAVTPLVADEKPLWVGADGDGRVTRIGGGAGDAVTAGFYLVPPRLRHRAPPAGLGRLREYLAWLVEQGEPVYAETIETIVDVDRTRDVALAESLAGGGPRVGPPEIRAARTAPGAIVPEVSW
jgi:NDP-sugar pyrophosphorylase family protein